jgi:hypothetical protein
LLLQVEELHGEMTKMGRQAVLEGFRKGSFPLLLVNDVAARGLDLPQVGFMFGAGGCGGWGCGWVGGLSWQARAAGGCLRGQRLASAQLRVQEGNSIILFGAGHRATPKLTLRLSILASLLSPPQIDVVVNLELPSNGAHYAHRAGRTGRMGSPGTVVTLVTPEERFVVERLSNKLGVPILVGDS